MRLVEWLIVRAGYQVDEVELIDKGGYRRTQACMTQGQDGRTMGAMQVRVLGSAQDGGVAQVGCFCAACQQVRLGKKPAPWVASLALVDVDSRTWWLIDASPDFPVQYDSMLVEGLTLVGIFLTHAHAGHYTGLMYLGREIMGVQAMPVYCTAKMAEFLVTNAPWQQLVTLGNIELRPVEPGVRLGAVYVQAMVVPHRNEYADTVGYLLHGPDKRLLYIPDIDRWDTWDHAIAQMVAAVDFALLDGTFFDEAEVRRIGRSPAEIPHPLVTVTMGQLEAVADRVYFTHLNHTNPLWDEQSAPSQAMRRRGFHLCARGQSFEL